MSNSSKKLIKTLLVGTAILVFGILFCCSQGAAMEALSYVIGIVFLLGGAAFILTSIIEYKRFCTNDGFTGAFLLSFGILFIAKELGYLILAFIPYALICIGALLLCDAIIYAIKKNKFGIIAYAIFGVAALVVGILLINSEKFNEYASLVFGIILICYALLIYVSAFLDLSKNKAKEEKKNVTIDAKVEDTPNEAKTEETNNQEAKEESNTESSSEEIKEEIKESDAE